MTKFSFVAILFLLCFVSTLSFALDEDEEQEKAEEVAETIAKATQNKTLKISEEAISSLAAQLSEEEFGVVKGKLLKLEYTEAKLAVALEELIKLDFSDEDIVYIKNTLSLYYSMLDKINQVAPLIYASNELKERIATLEKSLETLLKKEQGEVLEEIEELKEQRQNTQDTFQTIAQKFDFNELNFDRLPGMLADLGYEDSFYDAIYAELSTYLAINRKVKTANSIIQSLQEVSIKIKELEDKFKNSDNDEQKQYVKQSLTRLIERKNVLKNDFTLNATGIDVKTLKGEKTEKVNWEEELKKVFSPVIVGLTEFTEPARRIEFLRSDVASYEQFLPKLQKGLEQIEILIEKSSDREVTKQLREEQEFWIQQGKEITTKLEVEKQQLLELKERKVSFGKALESFVETIFSKRGRDILASIGIFFGTLIGILLFRRLIMFLNPLKHIPRFRFIANLIDVFLYMMAFVIATSVLVFSLYVAGEILALGIVLIILLGMVWTLRNAIPMYIEQIKLLIGFGAVRQGEKLIYNGISWKVDSIGLYCYLHNPMLPEETIRLPIKDLINLRSRPYKEDKVMWFPCKEGDFVVIDDKHFRQVTLITPERIKLSALGAEESMPTQEFLEERIRNLSAAPFFHGTMLHIAYEHRFDLYEHIIGKLQSHIEEGVKALPLGEHVMKVFVACLNMSDKSLELAAWVQSKPESAGNYNRIKAAMIKLCIEAANKYDWQILRFNAISHHYPDGIPNNAVIAPDLLESNATTEG